MQRNVNVWLLSSSSVQLGTLWIMKTSILPMLNSMPYKAYVDACQRIDMHVFHPIAFWNGLATTGLSAAQAIRSDDPVAKSLYAAGALGMGVVAVASEGVNRPIWRQIERWSPQRSSDGWRAKRRRWHLAHQARTLGAAVAAGAFVAAALR
ncbi:DUF1772 domain-containing protein [Streptomyces sulphureus]|uniref:DUF1772 domain-containing protein n=1 Tax=Streptomyces sulphureus TaxID=47758 RepID=UPI00037EAC76|nr:DUF1772 domain-containing protein [Streptomyces sulphureus]